MVTHGVGIVDRLAILYLQEQCFDSRFNRLTYFVVVINYRELDRDNK